MEFETCINKGGCKSYRRRNFKTIKDLKEFCRITNSSIEFEPKHKEWANELGVKCDFREVHGRTIINR